MMADAPKLIGAMLDILVKAIHLYPSVKPKLDARMADFLKWGIAITQAIGLTQADFENAYASNLNSQDDEAVRSSLVAELVIKYMSDTGQNVLQGTATDIKTEIEEWTNPVDQYGRPIGDLLSKRSGWPKTSKDFSIQLSEVAPALESLGYMVSASRTSRARGLKIEKLKKLDEKGPGQRTFDVSIPKLTHDRLREALRGSSQ